MLALSLVQRWSLLNFAIEVLRPVWEDSPKNGTEPLFGEVICETIFNTRAHQPPCGFINRARRRSRSLQNGNAPFGDIHEASWSVSHDQSRVIGQRLAPPSEPIRLSTNTRIVPSSSCVEGKPAIMS